MYSKVCVNKGNTGGVYKCIPMYVLIKVIKIISKCVSHHQVYNLFHVYVQHNSDFQHY